LLYNPTMIVNATWTQTASEARVSCMHDLATLRALNARASETCVRCGIARERVPLTLYEAYKADEVGNPVLFCDDCAEVLAACGKPLHRVRS